jgi:uncharacterized protein (TIGR02145 family)
VFTDARDGQEYRTVKIGGLVWMAENLNFKINGSWCYNNDEANGKTCGRLYRWDAAKAASPAGWRLPSREEWDNLVNAVGGKDVEGKKLKAKSGWKDKGNGTDDYGFSALPGGYRTSSGNFQNAGDCGNWWTATEYGSYFAYYRDMIYYRDRVVEYLDYKDYGFSVRCVRGD